MLKSSARDFVDSPLSIHGVYNWWNALDLVPINIWDLSTEAQPGARIPESVHQILLFDCVDIMFKSATRNSYTGSSQKVYRRGQFFGLPMQVYCSDQQHIYITHTLTHIRMDYMKLVSPKQGSTASNTSFTIFAHKCATFVLI